MHARRLAYEAGWLGRVGLLGCALASCDGDRSWPQPEPFEDATTTGMHEPPPSAALPAEVPPAVPWRSVGELGVDDFGEAGWISISYPERTRYVAIRSLFDPNPEATARACHRVVEARLASGQVLIPEPTQSAGPPQQRLRPGPGGGVFILSSAATPLDAADTLQLRIGLFDCGLGIPASRARFPQMPRTLRIDAAWEDERDGEATVAVRILRAEDSGWGAFADDPASTVAWDIAVERFADAGITLKLEAEVSGPATGTLRSAPDMLGLGALEAEARRALQGDPSDARFVPVVFVRCLELDDATGSVRHRPLGHTNRIPGSFADPRTPSLVVLPSGCDPADEAQPVLDPERRGLVLAHEIAHYLGLLHVDHDGDHLPADPDEQLMRSSIAQDVDPSDAWFSAAQAAVLRRHPDVVVVP